MNWNQYSNAYNKMIKRAGSAEKDLAKLQTELNDYDKYRDTFGPDAARGELFNDLKMQSRASDVVSRVEDIRRRLMDMDDNTRNMYAEQLAVLLRNSRYYNQDKGLMASMRGERRNRLASLWLGTPRTSVVRMGD